MYDMHEYNRCLDVIAETNHIKTVLPNNSDNLNQEIENEKRNKLLEVIEKHYPISPSQGLKNKSLLAND